MVAPTSGRHDVIMENLPGPASRAGLARVALLLAILVPFTAWTTMLCFDQGYLGFVHLALREQWGLQMLLDLGIMVGLFSAWVIRDAKDRGIAPWPWIVAALFLGSPVALTYLIARELGYGKSPSSATARRALA